MCSTTAGTAETCIEMERSQLQLRGDILVKCYAVNTVTNQLSPRSDVKLLFRCQFHTSALNNHSFEFSASDLDIESPAGRKRSLEGLRVDFKFSPTSSTAWCKSNALGLLCHTEHRAKAKDRSHRAVPGPTCLGPYRWYFCYFRTLGIT